MTSVNGRGVGHSMERAQSVIIVFSRRVAGNFVGYRQKLLHIGELSSVKLLSLIKTQFILALMQGRRLLCCVHCDTCGLYPSQKFDQLGRNLDWFVVVFSRGVVYRQIHCDHFGCYTAGSHLIIGLERTNRHVNATRS